MRKRWNVMVVPNSPGEKILSFDLSSRFLSTVAISVAFFIVLSAAFALYAIRSWQSEKLSQVSLLESQVEEREAEFIRLKEEFTILEQLEDKLRTIAGLKPTDRPGADSAAGGQGGPGLGYDDPATTSMIGLAPRTATHRNPSELLADSSALRDRFEEVLDVFQRERARLSCIPSINPVASQEAWISSGFGYRKDPINNDRRFHEGCDIVAPRNTPVIAPADGVVKFSGWREGLGRSIQIEHGYGYETTYGHNSKLLVKKGDRVKRGDEIARVGSSGRSTGPHLHYEVCLNGKLVNPYKYVIQ